MHGRSMLLVGLLLLGLAGLAWWQRGREADGAWVVEEPLCPGIETGRVSRIRVENLERDVFFVLQRVGEGRWDLIEPMAFPAEPAHASFLLQVAETNAVQPVPEEEAEAGFGTPRAVIEYFEDPPPGQPEAAPRVYTIDVGRIDADRQRVMVRTRGRLWRTPRNLDTALDRELADYRSKTIVAVLPQRVLELHRDGTYPLGDEALDMRFDALLDNGTWTATRPMQARLDAGLMGFLVVASATLEATDWADDVRVPLSELGLDPPAFTFDIVTVQDERISLAFGVTPNGAWTCKRADQPWIRFVDAGHVGVLASEVENLVDPRLVRTRRDWLRGVRIVRDGRELVLERDREAWTVAEQAARGTLVAPGVAPGVATGVTFFGADTRAVADVLARIEQAELGGLLTGVPFPAVDVASSSGFFLETDQGRQGGAIGPWHELPSGDRVRLFQRADDGVVGWIDPEVTTLLELTLEDLRSRDLLAELEEWRTARLAIEGLGTERVYERDGSRGIWRAVGSELPARELDPVLDKLFFLQAASYVAREDEVELQDRIAVSFTATGGDVTRIELGRTAPASDDPRVEVDVAGRRAILAAPGLYDALAELLGP